jgi:hypothetical protein
MPRNVVVSVGILWGRPGMRTCGISVELARPAVGAMRISLAHVSRSDAQDTEARLIRQSLDDFLLGSLDLYPGQVLSAVHAVARRTGRSGPTMTALDIAAYLQARDMPSFGKRLLADLD